MISATHFHAMAVHFPIALLMAGFLSELIGLFIKKTFFQQAAFYLLILGALGSIVSYLAGKVAGDGMLKGTLGQATQLHEQAATFALSLTVITAIFYLGIFIMKFSKSWVRIAGIVLFAVAVVAIARTGYLGGQLVYKHGAGVELALPDFSNPGVE